MTADTLQPVPADDDPSKPDDLFGKLDSLIQKHQGRTTRRAPDAVPMLTEPVEGAPPAPEADIPMLQDAVDLVAPQDDDVPRGMIEKRRQLQVALYLRLRQRLDQELNAALADNLRLGAVAIDPAFTRVAQELRSALPIVVRESVEQVFGLESLEALLGRPGGRGSRGR
jgi:hypothetical protein